MALAMDFAISTLSVSRFTLKATSGIRAPMAMIPAVGWTFLSPKSGAHSGCWSFSGIPSNCPLRILARFTRSGDVAESSYRKLGIRSSSQIRPATCLDSSTHSCTVMPMVGTKGITSVAPIRGWAP